MLGEPQQAKGYGSGIGFTLGGGREVHDCALQGRLGAQQAVALVVIAATGLANAGQRALRIDPVL